MVVACLALGIALGGTSVAAIQALPKNSVGTKQLKSNAVTSAKVKNRSLLAADFKAGQLPQGPKGDPGAPGAPGAPGQQGQPGPFTDTLPAGKSQKGTWAVLGMTSGANQYYSAHISYNFPLAVAPTKHYIASGAPVPAGCSGSVSNPGAAAGHLCVFAAYNDPGATFAGLYDPSGGGFGAPGKFGEIVAFFSTGANQLDIVGTWAVTAAASSGPAGTPARPDGSTVTGN
jgi:hypothetical protein